MLALSVFIFQLSRHSIHIFSEFQAVLLLRLFFPSSEAVPGDGAHQPVPRRRRLLLVRQRHAAQKRQPNAQRRPVSQKVCSTVIQPLDSPPGFCKFLLLAFDFRLSFLSSVVGRLKMILKWLYFFKEVSLSFFTALDRSTVCKG